MSQADIAMRGGQSDDAYRSYHAAALAERAAFELVPSTRPRTRGLLAINEVSLLEAATDLQEAQRRAHELLAFGTLPAFAEDELLDLALRIRRAKLDHANTYRHSSESLLVSLKGDTIRPGGRAPIDLVLLKMQQVKNYSIRVAEMVSGSNIRTQGRPSTDLLESFIPVVSPPIFGSHGFEVHIESPAQSSFTGLSRKIDPDEITVKSFAIIDALGNADFDQFKSEVTNELYQSVFLRMVRNLAPTGRDIAEIEVLRKREFAAVSLRKSSRVPLNRRIASTRETKKFETEHRGVLRALHLNDGWIILVEDGRENRLQIDSAKVFDDVVGPLVNRRVRVTGYPRSGRFYATDIIESTDDEVDESHTEEYQVSSDYPVLFNYS